jgi:recombination protein RecA
MKARLAKEAARLTARYGHKTGAVASEKRKLNVVPTGILALDYALGIGGWPLGHPVEVYGAPDIGKSSVLGLSAFSNAQRMGLTTGLIAIEPGSGSDESWLIKNKVDPELLVIARPDDGESAFSILYDWMSNDIVDFVIFDSIGAVLRQSESGPDGKPNQGGASSLITHGVKNILQPCWKNNKGLMFLNQQREDMKSRIPGQFESPGGQALKHACDIRIHLRAGRERFTAKVDGEDVLVGRELVAVIKRNKMSEGSNVKATFNYFQKAVDGQDVGIDTAEDIINTAIRTGVIKQAGAMYRHDLFPEANSGHRQLQGRSAVAEFLTVDSKASDKIREDVLDVMFAKTPIKEVEPVNA